MSTYDYSTTVDTGAAGAFVGGFLIVFFLIIAIAIAISVLAIIGQWKAFKKAGKGGWEAIIPIYNQVVNCQIVGISPWWVLAVFIGGFVAGLIPYIGSLLSMAISLYFMVILYVSTARSFGKSDGFAAGLYFLGPIFWFILGGKNTQYVGPRPMKDVVMNFINEKILKKGPQTNNVNNMNNMNNGMNMNNMNNGMNMNNMNNGMNMNNMNNGMNMNAQAQSAVKFCTGCGYKITNGERFCPGCGKEVQ